MPIVNVPKFVPNAAPEMVLLDKAELGMLEKVLLAPDIDLLVSVCEPVKVATVLSIAIVTAADPLYEVPDKPVPIVNAYGLAAVIVPDAPKATFTPL